MKKLLAISVLALPLLAQVSGLEQWSFGEAASSAKANRINNALNDAIGLKLTDPTTTSGDMIYRGVSGVVRLSVGSNGQCLVVSGGVPTWGACPGGGATYPPAGIPQSTGSAWGSSLTLVTSLGNPGANTNIPSEAAVRAAIAAGGGGGGTAPYTCNVTTNPATCNHSLGTTTGVWYSCWDAQSPPRQAGSTAVSGDVTAATDAQFAVLQAQYTDTNNVKLWFTATPSSGSKCYISTGSMGPQGTAGSPGSPGTNGNTVLTGSGAPSNGTGANGDFYINTTSWLIYGPKASGTWPSGVSLVGPSGGGGGGIAVLDAQTGTSYTIPSADCSATQNAVVTFSNASAVAVTLPQAGAGGNFLTKCAFTAVNIGAGTVTITPTTSTINGDSVLSLNSGQSATIISNGTNYIADLGTGIAPSGTAFPNCTKVGQRFVLTSPITGTGNYYSKGAYHCAATGTPGTWVMGPYVTDAYQVNTPYIGTAATTFTACSSGCTVYVSKIEVGVTTTMKTLRFSNNAAQLTTTNGVAGCLFDSAGNLLGGGAITGVSTTGARREIAINGSTGVLVTPGEYYFGLASEDTTMSVYPSYNSGTNPLVLNAASGAGILYGTAANKTTGTGSGLTCPATMGALTSNNVSWFMALANQ